MAEPADLILAGGLVVVPGPDSTLRLVQADVVVANGRIDGLTDPGAGRTGPTPARRLDARGGVVLPGFVNAHMHECLDRGFFEDMPFDRWLYEHALPKDRAYEPRHMRAAALMNQAEMIRNGTTTFIDIFRHPAEAAAVAMTSGVRATFSPQLIEEPEGSGESLATSEAFVDQWRDRSSRVRAWFGPHGLYSVSPATLGQVRQLADHYGVGIHIHLAETPSETDTVRARFGTTPTQALDQLVGLGPDVLCAHCIELTDDDIETLAASRAGVAHCATSNMKLGNGVARIRDLLAAGAVVGLGTDSIMTNNNLDPFEEMRIASLLQKQAWRDPEVMTAADVLQLATLGSARALGLATEIGSIEVGKRADLIVVGFDEPRSWPLLTSGRPNVIEQLVWSCSGSDVRHTVVDGQVLMEHRQLLTLDLDEIRELVGVEARHLLGRAGLLADDGIGSTDA